MVAVAGQKEILKALSATKFLRRAEDGRAALRAFLLILDPSVLTKPIDEIVQEATLVGSRILFRSRVRLDAAMMLVHRHRNLELSADQGLWRYVLCDASPQWRSVELFGVWVDTSTSQASFLHRRLLPLGTLGSFINRRANYFANH